MPGDSNIVETLSPFVALLLSATALAAVCGEGIRRRHYRQSVWIAAPEKLLANPVGANVMATIGGLAGLVAAITWMPVIHQSAWSPVGLALAGLAILGWGHFLALAGIGFAGLLAVGAGVAAMPAAWFGATTIGPLVGWILAAGWMLWLAKFWDQQLDDGRAWTTTGALIPMARGAALFFGGAVLVQSGLLFCNDAVLVGTYGKSAVVLLLCGLVAGFWRSARRQRSIASTIGIWLTCWSGYFVVFANEGDIPFQASMYALVLAALSRVSPLCTPPNTTVAHLTCSRFLVPCLVAILFFQVPSQYPVLTVLALMVGAMQTFAPNEEARSAASQSR